MKIAIIGKGNVGTHLAKAFSPFAEVSLVDSRSLDGMPGRCDVAIIAVKDDAVGSLAGKIKGSAHVVCHTSGSVPMAALAEAAEKHGVLYPMQTFTRDAAMKYDEIPFFIEGSDAETAEWLAELARMVSENVHFADSETRKTLHLAAVFACNFSNLMMDCADRILSEKGLDYKAMLPLLHQTVNKLDTIPPRKAQTGPAVRHDRNIMALHMDMLANTPDLQDIYRILSQQIENFNSEK